MRRMLGNEVQANDKPKRIAECGAHGKPEQIAHAKPVGAHPGADDSSCPDRHADAGAKRCAVNFAERIANDLAVCAADVSAFFVSIEEPVEAHRGTNACFRAHVQSNAGAFNLANDVALTDSKCISNKLADDDTGTITEPHHS